MIPALAPSSPVVRLGWLDVLRGWAALVVALQHASYFYLPGLRGWLNEWFDLGTYGVLVFFLVSGYIVPASLERRGSVRAFWIGRFFRIYPLLAVACVLAVLPFGLRAGLEEYRTATAVVAHLTMLQDLLAVPSAMNVLWTLSYEMAFYLLIVALFVGGAHRRSAPVAMGLAGVALLAGGALPMALLSRTAGTGAVVAAAAVMLVAAIGAAMSDRPAVRVAGGLLGGLLALVLVTANGRLGPWLGLAMMALMFTGTAVHRAEHHQIGRRAAVLTACTVLAAALATGLWNARASGWGGHVELVWCGPVVLAAATFGAAWALRRRSFPRWAVALGTASYSIYLLHPLLLIASGELLGRTGGTDVAGLAVFAVVLLAASWAAQRWIEAPAQRLGRRVVRRVVPVGGPPVVPQERGGRDAPRSAILPGMIVGKDGATPSR
ncbi:acyltransferase family protein [Actinomadura rubrisoli]|uniref:Acyltransferase n=1 Tax=Actinomadura rubrisoli TaxID=2530368 RepID=A0A4R5AWW1_9ACTN|nr:acyltransferase [Actinomadura rubrisoli]TDD76650.1 acyltransferase [Actinomadura rubrisoli]